MTVTVKLITEQTTNQLVDSVNKAQTEGWFPVCGVVCFNARYTQLMAHDTEHTEVPKCNYFIVDSEDGVDFAQRVNRLIALNTGAVCLSSVQYEQARYIQAWGDDSLHSGGGGNNPALKWYQEEYLAGRIIPAIRTDPTIPYVTVDGTANQYSAMAFVSDYGTGDNDMVIPLQMMGSSNNGQYQWQITGDLEHTGQIHAQNGYMLMQCGGTDMSRSRVQLSSGAVGSPKTATIEAGATGLLLNDMLDSQLNIAQGQNFSIARQYGNLLMNFTPFESVLISPTNKCRVELLDTKTSTTGNSKITVNGDGTTINSGRMSVAVTETAGVRANVPAASQISLSMDNNTKFIATNTYTTVTGGTNRFLRMDASGINLESVAGANFPVTVRSNGIVSLTANNGVTTLGGTGGNVITNTTTGGVSINAGSSSIGVVKDHDVVVRAGTVFRLFNGLDEELIRGSDVILRFARGSASAEIVNGGITLKANGTNIMAPSVTINTTGTSVRGNVFPALVETDTLGIHQKPWLKVFSNYSPIVVEPMAFTSGTIPTDVLQKWGQVNPRLVTMAHGVEYRYIATDIIGVLGLADAELYGLVYDDPVTPTNYAVNQTACLTVADAWRRQNATREAIVESQERICGLVPGNGLNANHPLGDSGYAIRVTGKTNGDFDLYITDATPGRNMAYLYRKQTGTGIFEENSSQSVATTAAFKINTTDVNSSASVEVRVYVSDITTGRAWQIRIWPQSRTTRRYNMSIFEMTEGDTPIYRDYSL